MWLRPGSKPLAFKAEQAIAAAEVGFLWRAWLIMTAGVSMQVIDYTVGRKAGLECRLLGALPIIRMSDRDTMFRGEAMRFLAELMWNPDALLLNRQLDWKVINARTLVVATGGGTRRCEVRLILDDAGDLIGIEADDRPRQDEFIYWCGRVDSWSLKESDAATGHSNGLRCHVSIYSRFIIKGTTEKYPRQRSNRASATTLGRKSAYLDPIKALLSELPIHPRCDGHHYKELCTALRIPRHSSHSWQALPKQPSKPC